MAVRACMQIEVEGLVSVARKFWNSVYDALQSTDYGGFTEDALFLYFDSYQSHRVLVAVKYIP